MHKAVEDAGGLAVGLMLDMDASEIGSFAITGPMFAGSPEPPIAVAHKCFHVHTAGHPSLAEVD